MHTYKARKLKFKAWNLNTRLMMRLNSIDCVKGELVKQGHILLQFTGHYDQHHEEIYEQDVLLADSRQYVVCWHEERGWIYQSLSGDDLGDDLVGNDAKRMSRLCSYFEMGE